MSAIDPVVKFLLETYVPLLLFPLLILTFGGFAIAARYFHRTDMRKEQRKDANLSAVWGTFLFIGGVAAIIMIYIVPLLTLTNSYWQIGTAAIVAFNASVTAVHGNNMIWEVALCAASLGTLRRITGTARKKAPRTAERALRVIFWIFVALAIALPVIAAVWQVSTTLFHFS